MKKERKLALLQLLFFPVYLTYTFLVSLALNIYVLDKPQIVLLTQFDVEWTLLLWGILVIPAVIFYFFIKGQGMDRFPIFILVFGIVLGTITADSTTPLVASYLFNKEGHVIQYEAANAEKIIDESNAVCSNIIFNPTQGKLTSILIDQSKHDTALSNVALDSINYSDFISLLLPKILIDSDSYYINDTLYIEELDKETYKSSLLPLTKSLVSCKSKKYIDNKDPEVSLLTTEEYQVIRRAEMQEDIENLDKIINKYEELIKDYEKWLKQAQYYYEVNMNYYLAPNIKQAKEDIASLKKYLKEYKDRKYALENSSDEIIMESGVFLSPNTIHVELPSSESRNYTAQITSTSVHEYYHYVSSNPKKTFPTFFTEGFTEIMNIDTQRKNGIEVFGYTYSYEVFVIRSMIRDIGYNKLIDTYLKKDEAQLKKLLNNQYGKDFYKNSSNYFDMVSTLDSKGRNEATNSILAAMGHKAITFSDLMAYPGYDIDKTSFGIKKE